MKKILESPSLLSKAPQVRDTEKVNDSKQISGKSIWSCCMTRSHDVSIRYESTKVQAGASTDTPSRPQVTIKQPSSAKRYRCFLTHNWGSQQKDGTFGNHERVRKVYSALQKLDIPCWFDSDRMTGTIIEQMSGGIDDSDIVIGISCTVLTL